LTYLNCSWQNDENTFGFETPSKQACKSLYKCCSQHLAFFRLVQTSGPPLGRDQSGRHLPQGANFKILPTLIGRGGGVASGDSASRSPPQFRRLPSRRHQRRIDGAPSDGNSHLIAQFHYEKRFGNQMTIALEKFYKLVFEPTTIGRSVRPQIHEKWPRGTVAPPVVSWFS
jgi:FERM C-terminal PH-like domain